MRPVARGTRLVSGLPSDTYFWRTDLLVVVGVTDVWPGGREEDQEVGEGAEGGEVVGGRGEWKVKREAVEVERREKREGNSVDGREVEGVGG